MINTVSLEGGAGELGLGRVVLPIIIDLVNLITSELQCFLSLRHLQIKIVSTLFSSFKRFNLKFLSSAK